MNRAEQQVAFLSTILQNVADSVIVTDLEGRIQHWNPGAEKLFGYTAAEMLGHTPTEIYPDQDPAALAIDLESILAGHDYVGEWRGRRKDGTSVWVDVRTTVMREASGRPIGFIGIGTDSTRRKQAEEARQRVLSVLSHDLRNPLSTISLSAVVMTRLIASGASVAELQPHIERVAKAGRTMSKLIEGLLDLARMDSGQILGARSEQSVAELLAGAREAFETLAEKKRQRIEIEPVDRSLRVRCDPDRVMQVFSNLLGNASRHAPESTRILLSARAAGDFVELAVADQGPGIAPDALARVFDRYWKATHTGGVGLGLSIVKGIVEAHGGKVWAESEQGRGATFRFLLPAV